MRDPSGAEDRLLIYTRISKGLVHYPEEHFSAEAKSCVQALLEPDQARRIATSDALLRQPWIAAADTAPPPVTPLHKRSAIDWFAELGGSPPDADPPPALAPLAENPGPRRSWRGRFKQFWGVGRRRQYRERPAAMVSTPAAQPDSPGGGKEQLTTTITRAGPTASFGIGLGTTDNGLKVVTQLSQARTDEGALQLADVLVACNGVELAPLTHAEALSVICQGTSAELRVVRKFSVAPSPVMAALTPTVATMRLEDQRSDPVPKQPTATPASWAHPSPRSPAATTPTGLVRRIPFEASPRSSVRSRRFSVAAREVTASFQGDEPYSRRSRRGRIQRALAPPLVLVAPRPAEEVEESRI